MGTISDARQLHDDAAEYSKNSEWAERAARVGYIARGIVYIVVGVLALLAALGMGGEVGDGGNALQRILEQPYGRLMLAAVAIGLVCFVVWRLLQVVLNVEEKKNDVKGITIRVVWTVSAFLYGALALQAILLVTGNGGGSGDNGAGWVATVMDAPAGRWIVCAVGIAIMAAGIASFVKAYKAKFLQRLHTEHMNESFRTIVKWTGRVGNAARGVVFLLIGLFVIQAALNYDPHGATRGLTGALRTLGQQSYGPWLLGFVSFGLAAFGVYQLFEGWYRKIPAES